MYSVEGWWTNLYLISRCFVEPSGLSSNLKLKNSTSLKMKSLHVCNFILYFMFLLLLLIFALLFPFYLPLGNSGASEETRMISVDKPTFRAWYNVREIESLWPQQCRAEGRQDYRLINYIYIYIIHPVIRNQKQ